MSLNEEINVPELFEGDVDYEVVPLTEAQLVAGNPTKSGLRIDGITVRVDDIKMPEPAAGATETTMNIDYKLVDGIPENIDVFEAKLAKVMMHVIDSYIKE